MYHVYDTSITKLKLGRIEDSIVRIKKQLYEIGDLRPGSLTQQKRKSKTAYGAYWHLSYTHDGKGHTEYIRSEAIAQVKAEVKNYQRYRKLSDQLIKLSIEKSKLKMALSRSEST